MQTLSKGANAPLTSPRVTVRVSCARPLDVSALLLGESGKVRSDDDMVFYNQPTGPGVRHRAGSAGQPDAVDVSFAELPADVHTVAVTASLDGGGAFGGAGTVAVEVLDETGQPAVRFDVADLATETALLCVELYRRQGAWKVRAVGQGWASGLAGIATDFGITVDDAPAAPPASRTSPPSPASPPAAAAPPAPAAPSVVNLDKGRVSLAKKQTVSLVKTGAPALTLVRMGLGWDPARRGADVDLDASVICFDTRGKDVEKVWFGQLQGFGGAVQHSGDNLTGEGEGDDEVITVHLDRLPRDVEGLVFTVNSFRGQRFTELKSAYCRLLDDRGTELVRYDLTETEPTTGVLLCKLVRQADGTWSMTALGDFHDGRNVKKMVNPARATLGWR